jgi:hypothetical protein
VIRSPSLTLEPVLVCARHFQICCNTARGGGHGKLFCPICHILLRPTWVGPMCPNCGRPAFETGLDFKLGFHLTTTSAVAYHSLRPLAVPDLGQGSKDSKLKPAPNFVLVEPFFPRVLWNGGLGLRQTYFDSIEEWKPHPGPTDFEDVPFQLAVEQTLVDLKLMVYGSRGGPIEFDPSTSGPKISLYNEAAGAARSLLIDLQGPGHQLFYCDVCCLISSDPRPQFPRSQPGTGCRDCLGTRRSLLSSLRTRHVGPS